MSPTLAISASVSPSEARESGTLDDEAILAAVAESREDESERCYP
ncbi:MAG: hypothetical protein ACKOEG_06660 [Chthoniobacterales bacterium]